MAASTQTGMGARAYAGGCGFRVWAPFAEGVCVAGDFNGWSPDAHPLTHEGGGYWSTDVPGARVGQEYRYVLRHKGAVLWRNDPYAREISHGDNNSVIHPREFAWEGDEAFQAPPWNELVIYELHIGTFNDDPAPGPGLFEHAAQKLDYLRELGVNAIEIMAAGEFATDRSWGYNPAYLFAIEKSYGGLDGFRGFVKEAHARGLAVIFDVVYNHLGDPAEDMWRFDGWSEQEGGGIYFYNDWRSKTPWGDTRPDYGRSEVRQYLRDNAQAWLTHRHVDGLRWDATAYIRNVRGNNDDSGGDLSDGWRLMRDINHEIDSENRRTNNRKISIAEDLQGNEWLTRPVHEDGAGFGAQWDSGFVHPVRGTLAAPYDWQRDMHLLEGAIRGRYNGDAFRRVIYTESHDEAGGKGAGKLRLPEEIHPGQPESWFSRKRSTLGAVLVFTSPGIPMLFQGQEFLEYETFTDRKALDWFKAARYSGILNLYRDLIRLRRNWYDHTRGLRGQHVHVHHVNNTDKVLAFHRWDRGGPRDDVVVVLNLADRSYDSYTLGFPRPGEWKVRFNSDWSGYSSDFGSRPGYDTTAGWERRDRMPCSGNVGIGPYSALILSQDG